VRRGVAAALAAGALLAAAAAAVLLRPAPHRPHVVVLLWDTTRADRLTPHGHARETTPWLASLAARGVLFENCRAPSPWTLPSHASLFTGLMPSDHGALHMRAPLMPHHRTLAEDLAAAGYDTLLVYNNEFVGPPWGLAQGFARERLARSAEGKPTAAAAVAVLREELGARAADPERRDRPLFLFVNLLDPHLPYDPPESLERAWRLPGAAESEVRALREFGFPREMEHNLGIRVLDGRSLEILGRLYDAELRETDARCAEMEDLLAAAGILGPGKDSLLVVTSDHGENLGEEGLVDHKLSVSDALLHVPLVLHRPGTFEGGRREAAGVGLQDLHPTILEAAGLPVDGVATPAARSLRAPDPGRVVVSEFPAPLPFLEQMRIHRAFRDYPPATFARFHDGLLAATASPSGGRLLKWTRRSRGAFEGSPATTRETLHDLAADPREERDLLAVPEPAAADRAAAAALAAAADGLPR
jgi:arylsulfatase A-like enzyme